MRSVGHNIQKAFKSFAPRRSCNCYSGNIGRPGGGILALRGHASIQGSTDIPTLYDILPGYLPMPCGDGSEATLRDYLANHTKPTGLWHSLPAYFISLLKAYYGKNATAENDFGYDWVPKITSNHSFFEYLYDMADGKMEGMFMMGQNPAVAAANSRFERTSLSKLKWLVVREMVEIEPATFWRDSPEIERGELKTEEIETEVFFFPAAGHAEKEGAFTQTQRMLQWREKAVDPPGDARSEAWFMHQLALRLIAKAKQSNDPLDEPLRALDWWYPEDEFGDPHMESVLAEINGWYTAPQPDAEGVVFGVDREGNPHHGPQVDGFGKLKADGSTAAAVGFIPASSARTRSTRRTREIRRDYLGHGWGFVWPADRRIIYNRASAKPTGEPWSERKKLVWWDQAQRKWTGHRRPRFSVRTSRQIIVQLETKAGSLGFPATRRSFCTKTGSAGCMCRAVCRMDRCRRTTNRSSRRCKNALYSRDTNPAVHWFTRQENRFAPPGDPRFPFVLTTYRLTEHHTAGGMSRFLSHLAELQPELFAEMSPELARRIEDQQRRLHFGRQFARRDRIASTR